MISATYRAAHAPGCPYLTWFAQNARWQPNLPEGGPLHPLSLLVREIMVEELCSCCSTLDRATPLVARCPQESR